MKIFEFLSRLFGKKNFISQESPIYGQSSKPLCYLDNPFKLLDVSCTYHNLNKEHPFNWNIKVILQYVPSYQNQFAIFFTAKGLKGTGEKVQTNKYFEFSS